jgi:hypothetical protein
MSASIDGVQVFSGEGFTWDKNDGSLLMELGAYENTMLDNLVVSTFLPG